MIPIKHMVLIFNLEVITCYAESYALFTNQTCHGLVKDGHLFLHRIFLIMNSQIPTTQHLSCILQDGTLKIDVCVNLREHLRRGKIAPSKQMKWMQGNSTRQHSRFRCTLLESCIIPPLALRIFFLNKYLAPCHVEPGITASISRVPEHQWIIPHFKIVPNLLSQGDTWNHSIAKNARRALVLTMGYCLGALGICRKKKTLQS